MLLSAVNSSHVVSFLIRLAMPALNTAMLLAAGRGERLKPLTNTIPKPLLKAGNYRLIEYHLHKLRAAKISNLVINLSHLGQQIREALGNGENYDLRIRYSDEGPEPLETAGGIVQALPLLGDQPFILINADVWTDLEFSGLHLPQDKLAHLCLVDNPQHHPQGDFALHDNLVMNTGPNCLTYSGIGVYHPRLFTELPSGKRPLAPVLRTAIETEQISGFHYQGTWFDVGTAARLQTLRTRLENK